jgi:hypothetical protein
MGCSDSRSNLSEEEAAITKVEYSLGFAIARQADLHFKYHAVDQKINKPQFLDAVTNLKLRSEGLTNPLTKLGKYYESYKNGDVYDADRLVILGVMLSRCEGKVKADILFDHVDPELTKTMTKGDFEELVKKMLEVSDKYNTDLGVGQPADHL